MTGKFMNSYKYTPLQVTFYRIYNSILSSLPLSSSLSSTTITSSSTSSTSSSSSSTGISHVFLSFSPNSAASSA